MYSMYKPLRNKLRKYNVYSGLRAIYFIMQHLQFGADVPPSLRYRGHGMLKKLDIGVFEWELSTLSREFLLNATATGGKTIESWNEIMGFIRIIRNIENEIWGKIAKPGDIEAEMHRIAHRQFPWQTKNWFYVAGRYYQIYSNDSMSKIVNDTFGMSARELFQVGVGLASMFMQNHAIEKPVKNEINDVSEQIVANFADRVSFSIDRHRSETAKLQRFDIDWAYARNSLDEIPLISHQGGYICVCPSNLFKRITEGTYFDLVPRADFANSLGRAFEAYVGDYVKKYDTDRKFRTLSSMDYGSRSARKAGSDWIISDGSSWLFVECKSGRIKSHFKVELASKQNFEAAVDALSNHIVQLYSTFNDAMNGRYGYWSSDGSPCYLRV